MGNALAKLFSWADGVKRRVSNPLETIALGLQRGTEDLAAAGSDADIAYGRGGMNSVLVSPQQKADAAQRAAEFGLNMGMAGATVWHGSPHKFDKFDASKIGTGEGAQAYGHGLYLAESPAVAKGYQEKLTDPAFKYAAMNEAKARLNEKIAARVEVTDPARAAALRAEVASLGEAGGSLYKADLPDSAIAKMIDYDKPLHRQAPEVRKAVRGVVDEALGAGAYGGIIRSRPDFRNLQNDILENLDPSQIAGALRSKGVPGIKYLDEGSRNRSSTWMVRHPQGGENVFSSESAARAYARRYPDEQLIPPNVTRNMVVFPGNENLLSILERNGVPIK